MPNTLVTLYSTGPDHQWIQEFEESLIQQGLDTKTVNSFHRCLAETGNDFDEAQQLFKRLDAETRHKIHFLLAPARHKHYLRSLVESTEALHEDENTRIVYDTSELAEGDCTELGSTASVGMVIRWWKETFPDRVLSRDEALQYLQEIMPMRQEVAASQ